MLKHEYEVAKPKTQRRVRHLLSNLIYFLVANDWLNGQF